MLTEFVPTLVTDIVVAEDVTATLEGGTVTVKFVPVEGVTAAAPAPVMVGLAAEGILMLTEFDPTVVTDKVEAELVTATFKGGTCTLYEFGASVVFTAAPDATNVVLEAAGMLMLTEFDPTVVTDNVAAELVTATFKGGT